MLEQCCNDRSGVEYGGLVEKLGVSKKGVKKV